MRVGAAVGGMLLWLLWSVALSAGEVHYLGVSVEEHRWHSTLTEWRHSRDWIGRVAQRELGVSAANATRLTDPTASELQAALKTTAANLDDDDLLIFYLGTHQLKKGRVLLGNKTETTGAELAAMLRPIPGRVLLLADVCYAAAFEEAAGLPDSVVRIYAADASEKTPSLDLSGRFRGAIRFYGDTMRRFAPAPESCSQFGMAFLDAMRIVGDKDDSLPIADIAETMRLRQAAFAKETRKTKTPEIVGGNLQPWSLRPKEQTTGRFSVAETTITDDDAVARKNLAALEEVLRLPPAAIDPARVNLMIGKIYDPEIDVEAYLAKVDKLAAELRPRVAGIEDSQQLAQAIAELLFEKHGFTAMPDAYAEDFLLHRLLDTRRGRCAALVSLYLGLGYRLQLPLQSYCVPEHVLVRTDDGVNLETTLRGVILPDAKYEALAAKVAKLEDQPFYLTRQNNYEHAGTLLSPLASALREKGRLALAETTAQMAVEINPNDAEAWNNLGMIQRLRDKPEAAVAAYQQAVRIHPGFAEAWNNLGVLQTSVEAKITHFRKAVGNKPKLGVAWKNLAIAYDEAGMLPLAWAAVRRCSQLGVALPRDFVERIRAANQ